MYSIYIDGAAGNNVSNCVYRNKEDAILNMVSIKDSFVLNAKFFNDYSDVSVQKEYHDLDCYLVALRIFVNGKYAALIQLNKLRVI